MAIGMTTPTARIPTAVHAASAAPQSHPVCPRTARTIAVLASMVMLRKGTSVMKVMLSNAKIG